MNTVEFDVHVLLFRFTLRLKKYQRPAVHLSHFPNPNVKLVYPEPPRSTLESD